MRPVITATTWAKVLAAGRLLEISGRRGFDAGDREGFMQTFLEQGANSRTHGNVRPVSWANLGLRVLPTSAAGLAPAHAFDSNADACALSPAISACRNLRILAEQADVIDWLLIGIHRGFQSEIIKVLPTGTRLEVLTREAGLVQEIWKRHHRMGRCRRSDARTVPVCVWVDGLHKQQQATAWRSSTN